MAQYRNGFIVIHRKMLDWGWYEDVPVFKLFLHCLLRANHDDREWKGIKIKRGQFYTSRKILAQETGLEEQPTRTALTKLKATGEITIQSTKLGSLITVVNYSKYQNKEEQATKQATKQATNEQPTKSKKLTNEQPIMNNDNNIYNKRDKEIKINAQKNAHDHLRKSFDIFWSEYPRKASKKRAFESWLKIRPDEDLAQTIIEAVTAHSQTDQWKRDGGQYIPHPATWLNQRRWEDELPKPKTREELKAEFFKGCSS